MTSEPMIQNHYRKSPQEEYEYAITMGCGDECPLVKVKHRADWEIPDPKYMEPEEFNKIRDLIEEKVKLLISGF